MKHAYTIGLIALAVANLGMDLHFDGETPRNLKRQTTYAAAEPGRQISCSPEGCRFEGAR